jgi:hypothetical protein
MFADTLPFASQYVSALAEELSRRHPEHPLSRLQQGWLSYCLTGLLLTGSLNWSAFERMGLGRYRIGARSWMFRRAQLLWSELLQASVSLLLRMFQIKHGILVVDDTDHRRAKKTTRIISQLHVDQLVLFQNKEMSVQDYFAKHPGTL